MLMPRPVPSEDEQISMNNVELFDHLSRESSHESRSCPNAGLSASALVETTLRSVVVPPFRGENHQACVEEHNPQAALSCYLQQITDKISQLKVCMFGFTPPPPTCCNFLTVHATKGEVYEQINDRYEEFMQTFNFSARLNDDIQDLWGRLLSISQVIEHPQVMGLLHLGFITHSYVVSPNYFVATGWG